MSLRDLLGLTREEEAEITEEPVVEEPVVQQTPQFATVDQMQQMVQSVAAQLQENLVGLVRGGQQQPQHREPEFIKEPSYEEIEEAFENGETKLALKLQAQREAAREQRYQYQLQQLRQEGQGWVSGVNSRLADSAVPDYKRYQKEVTKMMDELGLPAESRSNLQLIELLTNSVKGSKMEELLAERMEAQRRQENDARTEAPSGNRSNHLAAPKKSPISEQTENLMRAYGIDKERFAKTRGHKSWEDFEDSVDAFKAVQRGEGTYVPKWRRNKK